MVIARLKITYLATVAVAVLLLVLGNCIVTRDRFADQAHAAGGVEATVLRIVEVVQLDHDFDNYYYDPGDFLFMPWGEKVIFDAEITSGPQAGGIVRAMQFLDGFSPAALREVAQGNPVFLVETDGEWFFEGFRWEQEVVRARVRYAETFRLDYDMWHIMGDRVVFFEAEIRTGERRGEIVTGRQTFAGFVQDALREVTPGDSILLTSIGDDWFFNGFRRANRLLGLGIIFALLVLLFGGKKGFNTLFSLGLTCAAVFAVFIPSILSGTNIYLMALLVCVYTTVVTLLLVIGFNKKSLAAMLGCMSGIAVTGIITLIMDAVLFLTGVVDENSRFLMYLPVAGEINLRAIVFAGIIIGAMGAIMDVAMSISSSMWEIKENAGRIKFDALMRSGMTIGRDIFGTMANTLILAYIGTSLSVILLLLVHTDSLATLLNMEMIVVEILQALAGSFGILFTIPLTSFFCSTIYLRGKSRNQFLVGG